MSPSTGDLEAHQGDVAREGLAILGTGPAHQLEGLACGDQVVEYRLDLDLGDGLATKRPVLAGQPVVVDVDRQPALGIGEHLIEQHRVACIADSGSEQFVPPPP